MQANTVRIIAAVVDTHNLTLYKESGEAVVIPQGDPRIRMILDTVVPLLVKQNYADVDLTEITPPSEYAQFEEATNGAVKLFRIAKSKLKSFFGKKDTPSEAPIEAMTVGSIPVKTEATQPDSVGAAMNVVEDILQHAIPVASPEFHEQGLATQGNVVETSGLTIKDNKDDDAQDTIIAVVGDKVIPGVEKIKTQFSRAAALGSTQGVETFLARLGTVIHERKHSVEDLLKFMERGDLPIADDGCILIYKVLNLRNRSTSDGKRTFVDCHSGKVEQWVGGYVCMDPSLVDHNRNNECSNGLHVARRGYVREFCGDVCVLAKVAPEDVIAVPAYDANKMRVCGYHIIAELAKEQYTLVRQNKPITDNPDGKILLGKAMAGQHIGKTHEIRITGHMGAGVQVTELDKPQKVKAKEVMPVEALANPQEEAKQAPVDPKAVVKQVEQLSRKDMAAKLYAEGNVEALKAYKKAAKVSWDKLGVPDPDVTPPVVKANPITPELVSAAADAVEQFGEDELERYRDEQAAKITRSVRTVNDVVIGEGSPKERIQKLLAIGLTSVGVARAVLELKKKSKKSWTVLGVSDTQVEQITKLAE